MSRDLLEGQGWLGQRAQLRDMFEEEVLRRDDTHSAILAKTPKKFAFSLQLQPEC